MADAGTNALKGGVEFIMVIAALVIVFQLISKLVSGTLFSSSSGISL